MNDFRIPDTHDVVLRALAEDLGVDPGMIEAGDPGVLGLDATSASVIPEDARFSGRFVAREECVVCGLPLIERVLAPLDVAARSGFVAVRSDDAAEVFPLVAEGARVSAGDAIAEVEGSARVVLIAERTIVDLLMVLSGIATETRRWVEAAPDGLEVSDTRKTLPGLRALSKYAVRVGGGVNHRGGLWDMVLIKDNHLRHAGGIERAVGAARAGRPGLEIEVEADDPGQAAQAAAAGADRVLLDNMDDDAVRRAVRAIREASAGRRTLADREAPADRDGPVRIEASGKVGIERLVALADAGVDRVSTSAITLARPVDIALDENVPGAGDRGERSRDETDRGERTG